MNVLHSVNFCFNTARMTCGDKHGTKTLSECRRLVELLIIRATVNRDSSLSLASPEPGKP